MTMADSAQNKVSFYYEYGGQRISQAAVQKAIREDLKSRGLKRFVVKTLDVYVQPENNAIFYVANAATTREVKGEIPFFI